MPLRCSFRSRGFLLAFQRFLMTGKSVRVDGAFGEVVCTATGCFELKSCLVDIAPKLMYNGQAGQNRHAQQRTNTQSTPAHPIIVTQENRLAFAHLLRSNDWQCSEKRLSMRLYIPG